MFDRNTRVMETAYQPYIDPDYDSLMERMYPPRCVSISATSLFVSPFYFRIFICPMQVRCDPDPQISFFSKEIVSLIYFLAAEGITFNGEFYLESVFFNTSCVIQNENQNI